jgi:hypothetical protein
MDRSIVTVLVHRDSLKTHRLRFSYSQEFHPCTPSYHNHDRYKLQQNVMKSASSQVTERFRLLRSDEAMILQWAEPQGMTTVGVGDLAIL